MMDTYVSTLLPGWRGSLEEKDSSSAALLNLLAYLDSEDSSLSQFVTSGDPELSWMDRLGLVHHFRSIHLLAHLGKAEHITLLLNDDYNPSRRTSVSCSPSLFEKLKRRKHFYDGWSPIHAAAASGQLGVIMLLESRGVSLEEATGGEAAYTPLHLAAGMGHRKVVSWLLSQGVDFEMRTGWRWSPIHLAIGNGRAEVLDTLLPMANPNAAGPRGKRPLHRALEHVDFDIALRMATMLLGSGAGTDACNADGESPLHIALEYGNTAILKRLRDYGATLKPNASQDQIMPCPVSRLLQDPDEIGEHCAENVEYVASLGYFKSSCDWCRKELDDPPEATEACRLMALRLIDAAETFADGSVLERIRDIVTPPQVKLQRKMSPKTHPLSLSSNNLLKKSPAKSPKGPMPYHTAVQVLASATPIVHKNSEAVLPNIKLEEETLSSWETGWMKFRDMAGVPKKRSRENHARLEVKATPSLQKNGSAQPPNGISKELSFQQVPLKDRNPAKAREGVMTAFKRPLERLCASFQNVSSVCFESRSHKENSALAAGAATAGATS